MIIEYDRSPRISPEQRIQSLADSVMRAFEELESGKNITEPKPITLEDLGAYPKTGGIIDGDVSVRGNKVTLFGEAEEEGFVVAGNKPARFTGNMFFENNGNYIAGTTKDGKILGMFTPVTDNNMCLLGYGGYAESIGGTGIYGNEINFFTKGKTIVPHSVPFGIHALTVGCSEQLTLSTSYKKATLGNVYGNDNQVTTGVLEAYNGGIRVLRKGRYLVSAILYAESMTAGNILCGNIYLNDVDTWTVYINTGDRTYTSLAIPPKVMSADANSIFCLHAKNYHSATGKVLATHATSLTVVAID